MSTQFLLAAVVVALAVPAIAAADGPVAACPQPYELFLVPSDGSRPVAASLDAKGNGDGYACQKPQQQGGFNVTDNHIPSR